MDAWFAWLLLVVLVGCWFGAGVWVGYWLAGRREHENDVTDEYLWE
jgi:uncharacterized protein YneF (UPF0154 family)